MVTIIHCTKYTLRIIIALTLLLLFSCNNEDQSDNIDSNIDTPNATPTIEILSNTNVSPELDTLFLYNNAVEYLEIKEYKYAITRFTQIININPNIAIAYKGRGAAYYYEGLLDLAKNDLNKAIEIDPTLGGAYLYISMIQYDEGDFENADKNINKAINLIHPIREIKELEKANIQLKKIVDIK